MPSGITAPIYEGQEDFTFTDFMHRCSRQMGVGAHMRDEPLDKPLRYRTLSKTSYLERIAELEQRIVELQNTDLDALQKKYDAQYEQAVAEEAERDKERAVLRERYEKMRDEVADWVPPTPDHVYLQVFALEQLDEAIKWDCKTVGTTKLLRVDAEQMRDEEIKSCQRFIENYTNSLREEEERVEAHNAWIRAFFDSLPTQG